MITYLNNTKWYEVIRKKKIINKNWINWLLSREQESARVKQKKGVIHILMNVDN